jgi:hypothetical protein
MPGHSSTAVFIDLSRRYNINTMSIIYLLTDAYADDEFLVTNERANKGEYSEGRNRRGTQGVWGNRDEFRCKSLRASAATRFSSSNQLIWTVARHRVLPSWLINATLPVSAVPRLIHLWHVRHCFWRCPPVFFLDPSGSSSNETSKHIKSLLESTKMSCTSSEGGVEGWGLSTSIESFDVSWRIILVQTVPILEIDVQRDLKLANKSGMRQ